MLMPDYDNRKMFSLARLLEDELLLPAQFDTMIRDNVALAEAPAQRKDIFEYSPGSAGAQDYLALAKEIMERTEKGAFVE